MQNQTQTSPNFEVSKPKQSKPSGNFRPFCVSLDWLSVSCIDQGYIFYDREEQPSGYKLVAQNHGSTIYRSLFDIYDPSGVLVGELHAHPYNKSIDQRSVIVKADNALLYQRDGVEQLFACVTSLALYYRGINRIDLACDQNEFYGGRTPLNLIRDYFDEDKRPIIKLGANSGIDFFDFGIYATEKKGGGFTAWSKMPLPTEKQRTKQAQIIAERNRELAKVGLPLLDAEPAHAIDPADVAKPSRTSVTWGTRGNGVQVQLYNKTKELQEVKLKHHIVDAWKAAGLDISKDVWRVEIRIHGRGKGLLNPVTGKEFQINLIDCLLQEQIEELFFAYAERHFKFFRNTGHVKVRQNAPIMLWERAEPVLKPKQTKTKRNPTRFTLVIANAVQKERVYMASVMEREQAAGHVRTDYATTSTLEALDKVSEYFREAYLLQEWEEQQHLEEKFENGDILKRMPPEKRVYNSWKHSAIYEELLGKINKLVRPHRQRENTSLSLPWPIQQKMDNTPPPDLLAMAAAVEQSFRTITYCEYVPKVELEEEDTKEEPIPIDWDTFPYE